MMTIAVIVLIFIIFASFSLGFLFARHFVKKGAGIMHVCEECKYKTACADATVTDIEEIIKEKQI